MPILITDFSFGEMKFKPSTAFILLQALSLPSPKGDRQEVVIFPANLFVTSKDVVEQAIYEIQKDLAAQIQFFEAQHRFEEAKRIKERTERYLEMLR